MAKKQAHKAKRKGAKRGLTKAQAHKVQDIVSNQLEKSKETKYISDGLNSYTTYTTGSPGVDVANHTMFEKIDLVIPEGDDYKSRDGDKVLIDSLILRFRMLPEQAEDVRAIGGAFIPSHQAFIKNVLRFHLLRVDKTAVITAGEIDQCIKRPQELWVDNRQSAGKARRKAFTIIGKFELEQKFRDTVGLNASTIPPEMNILRTPVVSYVTRRFKLNKKTFFNAQSANEPVKYDYYLYGTWGQYNRGSYDVQLFPAALDMWKTWLFKDM